MTTAGPQISQAAQLRLDQALAKSSAGERKRAAGKPRDLSKQFAALDTLILRLEERLALENDAPTVRRSDQPVTAKAPPRVRRSRRKRTATASPPPPDPAAAAALLYEDIVWLFAVNDGEGALISLERMLLLGEPTGEALEFVETNTPKLLKLYEGYMGPFSRTVQRGPLNPEEDMPPGYLEQGCLAEIYDMIDGVRTLEEIMEASEQDRLTACAALKQLERSLSVQVL